MLETDGITDIYRGSNESTVGVWDVNLGRTLIHYSDTSDGRFRKRTRTSIRQTKKEQGSFINEIISNDSTLSTNGATGSYWYIRKNESKPYYLYKYIDNEIQTMYDVQTSQINTKKIEFDKPIDKVKILVDANNSDYKLSISNNNKDWTEIEDKTLLNGERDINLSEAWNHMYIKIEKNGSVINQIVVN